MPTCIRSSAGSAVVHAHTTKVVNLSSSPNVVKNKDQIEINFILLPKGRCTLG